MRVLEQVVENVGVQNGLTRQLLAELVTASVRSPDLIFREVEGVLLVFFIPLECTTLLVLLDRPTVGQIGLRVAVDDACSQRPRILLAEKPLEAVEPNLRLLSLQFLHEVHPRPVKVADGDRAEHDAFIGHGQFPFFKELF